MTDDLRARIADALRERMALVCRPGGELAAGELVDYIGATEHDLADAVLAVVQPPDEVLTREEAIALSDDLGLQLYRAEDRVAFVREMLTGRTGTVYVTDVLAWLDHQHCPRVESEQQQIARLTAERDRFAELLSEASDALRAVGKAAIVVEPTLAKPYPDAPHTSPWERFMRAPAKRAYNLGWQIRKELTGARQPSDQPARTTQDDPLTSTNTVDNPAAPHSYLSTGCLHGEHGYCQSNTGAAGTKIPAQCKFCASPCRCACHQAATP